VVCYSRVYLYVTCCRRVVQCYLILQGVSVCVVLQHGGSLFDVLLRGGSVCFVLQQCGFVVDVL